MKTPIPRRRRGTLRSSAGNVLSASSKPSSTSSRWAVIGWQLRAPEWHRLHAGLGLSARDSVDGVRARSLNGQYKRGDQPDHQIVGRHADGLETIVNSATISYRAESFEHSIVNDGRVNDDRSAAVTGVFPRRATLTVRSSGNGGEPVYAAGCLERRNPHRGQAVVEGTRRAPERQPDSTIRARWTMDRIVGTC